MLRHISFSRLQICIHLIGLGFCFSGQAQPLLPTSQVLFDPCARRNLFQSLKILAISFLLPLLLASQPKWLSAAQTLPKCESTGLATDKGAGFGPIYPNVPRSIQVPSCMPPC